LTFNSKLQVLGVAKINLKLLAVIFTAIAGFTVIFLIFYYYEFMSRFAAGAYELFKDREKLEYFIKSLGIWGPSVFIALQIFQVVLAPIPGEVTGFMGGYIFGTLPGFIYSTAGLTVGSVINFTLGRILGKRYVRKLIPTQKLEKFDGLVNRQGAIILFVLFVFPGFPKDSLCLFLGLTALPFRVFAIIATIGRMPGTFLLSLKGAYLYEKMYGVLAIVLGIFLILLFLSYLYREDIYRWVEKADKGGS